jgi:hypothetical protein
MQPVLVSHFGDKDAFIRKKLNKRTIVAFLNVVYGIDAGTISIQLFNAGRYIAIFKLVGKGLGVFVQPGMCNIKKNSLVVKYKEP